jgi:V8-like Glu-specific endopeptidase
MAEPDKTRSPTGDHESLSGPKRVSEDHEPFDGATTSETEKPRFFDGEPGEGSGMLERLPGVAGYDLYADSGEGCNGPVDGPLLDASPWAWILRLAVVYEDGSTAVYTGWLASPRVVVTSGRCLFDPSRGVAREVAVEAALGGGSSRRRWIKSNEFKMVKGWVQSAKPECDYGAVILPGSGASGIGYFGRAWLPGAKPKGEWLNLAGYPADRSDGTQWYEGFRIAEADERFLHRTGGFHESAAGSPLWLYLAQNNRAQRYVCGMVGSSVDSGEALRLHRDISNNLQDWIEKATGQSAVAQPGDRAAIADGVSASQATAPSG